MILNLMLLQAGLPPLIIKNKDRKKYYQVLSSGHKVDLTNIDEAGHKLIVRFCYQQMVRTYENIFAKWG
jgi:hypothetical protein